MKRRMPNRRGYALVMVAVFCMLFVTFIGVAWRQTASAICTFSARSDHIQQDHGAMMVMADAMRALEVGPPPNIASSPYVCYGSVTVPVMQNLKVKCPDAISAYSASANTIPCYYQLTFTYIDSSTSGTVTSKRYSVSITRNSSMGTPPLNINNFGSIGP